MHYSLDQMISVRQVVTGDLEDRVFVSHKSILQTAIVLWCMPRLIPFLDGAIE